jgi:hypothetical protein
MSLRKKCLFLAGAVLFGANSAFPGGIDISGTVVNCCGEPIEGVFVEYPAFDLSCKTDSKGNFIVGKASIMKNVPSDKAAHYDKLELFDLLGRRVTIADKIEKYDPKKKPASCFIVRFTGPMGQSRTKLLALSPGEVNALFKKTAVIFKAAKRRSFSDTLRISKIGFTTRSVPISRDTRTTGTIVMTKAVDAFSDCGQGRARSDSAVDFGAGALKDSLLLSNAGYEWSARGLAISIPGLRYGCLLDAKPWGAFSACALTGIAGSYSIKKSGLAGLTGTKLLEPVLSKNHRISGLILLAGAAIDSTSYVVLSSGNVMDQGRHFLLSIRQRQEIRHGLPFDSTALLSYFTVLEAERSGYFRDSSQARPDTVSVNASSFAAGGSLKLINSNIKINGSLSNISIVSSGTVSLAPDANLTNCRVLAQRILIYGGATEGCIFYSFVKGIMESGSHNSQLFSCDSIIIRQAVRTGPASLWVSKMSSENRACIVFERNKSLRGTAISLKEAHDANDFTTIHLDSGSVFSGFLVTDETISMKFVDITGSVYTGGIATQYNDMSYIDHLVGVSLHAPKDPLFFPLLGNDPIDLRPVMLDSAVVCY